MTEIPVFPPGTADYEPADVRDWGSFAAAMHQLFGQVKRSLPDPRAERREANNNVGSIVIDPTPVTLSAGSGFLDVPQLFRPSLGEWWDVHVITAQGFTAGTVQGYINMPGIAAAAAQGRLAAPFPGAGVLTFSKNHLPLRGGQDRLTFNASGITGVVLISMIATRVSDAWWGKYLC